MILADSGSFPSAKTLRDAICKELGWDKKKLLVTKNPNKITTLHLRYGNSSSVPCRYSGILNYQGFIRLISDKKYLNSKLKRDTKTLTTDFIRLSNKMPSVNDFPFIVRKYTRSSGGKGIEIFQNFEEFLESLIKGDVKYSHHWSPYFKFTEEYRVHVLGGKIGKLFRKNLEEEPENEIFIRNNDNSHFYRVALKNTPVAVIKVVNSFHKLIDKEFGKPLYFTALDVGITEEGEGVFIEANSAPGLNEATAEIYAKYILANSSVFSETEKEMKVVEELVDNTKNLGIDWAIQY